MGRRWICVIVGSLAMAAVGAAARAADDVIPGQVSGGSSAATTEAVPSASEPAAAVPIPPAAAEVHQAEDSSLEEVYPESGHVTPEECLDEIRHACRCCPEWADYFIFDVLFLQRNNATNGQAIAVGSDVSPTPGVPLLTTQSMQFATAPGLRLLRGHRGPDGVGWEIGYLGVYGMFADAEYAGVDQIRVPGDLGGAVPRWGTANVERPTYASSLNIVETNLFLYDCEEVCDPCGRLECQRTRRCRCTDWIGGFFWAGLNEQANLNVTCCEGELPTAYTVNTASNLFGAQVGLRRRGDWCRWAFERTYKVGLAGASLYQSGSQITSPIAPGVVYRDAQSDAIGGVGLLSQINLTAVYRINRQWGLRAGYNFIWLAGVALAPDQWDFTDTATSGSQLVNGGGVFLHGANLGLERRW